MGPLHHTGLARHFALPDNNQFLAGTPRANII